MPVVLDYDSEGYVINAHSIPEVDDRNITMEGWRWTAYQSYLNATQENDEASQQTPGLAPTAPMLLQQPVSHQAIYQYGATNIPGAFGEIPPDMPMNSLFLPEHQLPQPQPQPRQLPQQPLQFYHSHYLPQSTPMNNQNALSPSVPFDPVHFGTQYRPLGPSAAAAQAANHVLGSGPLADWAGFGLASSHAFEGYKARGKHARNRSEHFAASPVLYHAHPPAALPGSVQLTSLPPVINLAPKTTSKPLPQKKRAASRKSDAKVPKATTARKNSKASKDDTAEKSEVATRRKSSTVRPRKLLPSQSKHTANDLYSGDEVDITSPQQVQHASLVVDAEFDDNFRIQYENVGPTRNPFAYGRQNQRESLSRAKETMAASQTYYGTNTDHLSDAAPFTPQPQPLSVVQNQTKAEAFLTYFHQIFEGNQPIREAFSTLCRSFTEKLLTEAEFYVDVYRLIRPTNSLGLIAQFKEFLPEHWKKDGSMEWVEREIENDFEAALAAKDREMMLKGSPSGNKKPKKKVPVNGFRAGGTEEPDCDMDTGMDTPHRGSPLLDESSPMSDAGPNDGETTQTDSQLAERPTLIVKLPFTMPAGLGTPNSLPRKRKATPAYDDDYDASPSTTNTTSYTSPKKKRRYKLSDIPAADTGHVGPVYETRRAVLTREDKPYICVLCGGSFKHPDDVKHHFNGSTTNSVKGAYTGCWAKNGKPTGAGAEWNRHGSCRVALRDINYASVREGFVIKDQESLDRIEAACEMGRKFKMESGNGVDAERESDKEYGGSGHVDTGSTNEAVIPGPVVGDQTFAPPAPVQRPPPQRKIVRAGDENEVMIRAAALGLRGKR